MERDGTKQKVGSKLWRVRRDWKDLVEAIKMGMNSKETGKVMWRSLDDIFGRYWKEICEIN